MPDPADTGPSENGPSENATPCTAVLLRPWHRRDADAVLAAFAAPDMRWQTAEPVGSRAAARRWVATRAEERAAGTAYAFAVVDAHDADGPVLGNATVNAVNLEHGLGWVAYWTTPAARGRGVATRAARSLARWAFDDLGLFRLELGHRVDNPASCRVARAAGFRAEGLQRQKLSYQGRRHDVELHARLATDPDPGPGPGTDPAPATGA